MSQGLIISKEGFDVSTASEDELIYSSQFNSPKIFLDSAASIVVSGTTQKYTIMTHNLGYIPAFGAYVEFGAGSGSMWGAEGWNPASSHYWWVTATTTTLELNFLFSSPTAGTYRVYYMVYADPGKSTALSPTASETIGLKVTKPGSDANSTDLTDFSLHSNYPPPSIVKAMTLTLTNTSNATTTSAHGLGYRPAWLGTVEVSSAFYELPYIQYAAFNHDVWVTSTNVGVRVSTIAAPATYTFKVLLLNKAI